MSKQVTQVSSAGHKPPGAFTAFRWGFFCATVSSRLAYAVKLQQPAAGAAGAAPSQQEPVRLSSARARTDYELHCVICSGIVGSWCVLVMQVAIAIGQIALLDQRLTGIPWIYDGPLVQYAGRQVTIQYCLLSPNMSFDVSSRCNYATASAVVSLGLSLIWSYVQVLRRNPFKHKRAKLADLGLCCIGVAWWAAAGVALCIFTDTANKSGMMQSNWRNGLCVLAWAQFLMFTGLAVTSALLISPKTQKFFDKWTAKNQQKRQQKEAAKLQQQRVEAAHSEQQAAAARAAAAQQTWPAAATTPAAGPAAEQRLPV